MNVSTATASQCHARSQKSQYVQPKKARAKFSDMFTDGNGNFDSNRDNNYSFADLFGDQPDEGHEEGSDWRQKEAEQKQTEEEERKALEQQQNCTVVATVNETLLGQLGCHAETFDIAEEDCYQEWITVWYKGKRQLEIIQNGYWYIVPNS